MNEPKYKIDDIILIVDFTTIKLVKAKILSVTGTNDKIDYYVLVDNKEIYLISENDIFEDINDFKSRVNNLIKNYYKTYGIPC